MPTAEQVVPCRVPLRSFEWNGLVRTVHEGIIGDLEWIRHQWLLRGGNGWYPIRSWWGYHPRDCRTGAHPRGVALDVNPAENPMTAKRTPCISDMPADFIGLFKARGFGWGGDWRSKCDAMHFSKLKYEGGNGVLYVPANIAGPAPQPPPPPAGHSHPTPLVKNAPVNGVWRGQVYHPERSMWFVQGAEPWWEIRDVQQHLRNQGHDIVVDGFGGPSTNHHIVIYQRHRGLDDDGVVGPATWARLHG